MERMKDLTQQYVEQLNSIIKDLREEKFKLVEENERLKEELKEIEKNQDYRHHRAMVAERQVQHSLGGDDELIYEEGLYD